MLDRTYYLVRFDTLTADGDYKQLVSLLTNDGPFTVESKAGESHISHSDGKFVATLKQVTSSASAQFGNAATIIFQCDETDSFLLGEIRRYSEQLHYRLYDTRLECFLPQNPRLVDLSQFVFTDEAASAFRIANLTPLFRMPPSGDNPYYAKDNETGSIHIINFALMSYFIAYKVSPVRTEELSYPVASTLSDFVSKMDAGLIPFSFYRYFKKSLKTINDSDFSVDYIG